MDAYLENTSDEQFKSTEKILTIISGTLDVEGVQEFGSFYAEDFNF